MVRRLRAIELAAWADVFILMGFLAVMISRHPAELREAARKVSGTTGNRPAQSGEFLEHWLTRVITGGSSLRSQSPFALLRPGPSEPWRRCARGPAGLPRVDVPEAPSRFQGGHPQDVPAPLNPLGLRSMRALPGKRPFGPRPISIRIALANDRCSVAAMD